MKPIVFAILVLAPFLCVSAAADEHLEAWQERVIRALEESAEGNKPKDAQSVRPDEKTSLVPPREDAAGARKAAARAERNFGGKALAVQRKGKGYRVRLLLDDGRVKTVTVED